MNSIKRSLALLICLCILSGCIPLNVYAEGSGIGTYDNPENANDRFFSYTNSYLLNTDIAEGDTDGYWFEFVSEQAGIICIENSAYDASGFSSDNYIVTVECDGSDYYSFDRIKTNPINTLKVKKGQAIKINLRAVPDVNGHYPKMKIFVNLTMSYGNDNEPVYIKSKTSFIANVKASSTVVYRDGTSGGLYGGKGILITSDKEIIENTFVAVGTDVFEDTDKDGFIEFSLAGSEGAMIAAHHIISITNNSDVNAKYYLTTAESAEEGASPGISQHSITYIPGVESTCLVEGMKEYWHCDKCNKYFSDSEGLSEVEYSSLVIPTIAHDWVYDHTQLEPTVKEEGIAVYKCSLCGEEKTQSIPILERYQKGDLNNDGFINSIDLNLLKRILVGADYGLQATDAADIFEDDAVNAKDSYLLVNIIVGK